MSDSVIQWAQDRSSLTWFREVATHLLMVCCLLAGLMMILNKFHHSSLSPKRPFTRVDRSLPSINKSALSYSFLIMTIIIKFQGCFSMSCMPVCSLCVLNPRSTFKILLGIQYLRLNLSPFSINFSIKVLVPISCDVQVDWCSHIFMILHQVPFNNASRTWLKAGCSFFQWIND